MIAKLGFILILAVFGALMFVGGMLAPESLRQTAVGFGKQASRKLDTVFAKPATASTANGPAAAAGASTSAGSAAEPASAPQAAKADPIPAESLLIPTPLPDKGQYAVQVAQLADAGQASALGSRIKKQALPFDKVLLVVDQAGRQWSVVPVGPYASIDAARTARVTIANKLQLSDALPLILLPAVKPKS